MLAAVLHGPDDLRMEEVAAPSVPAGGLVVATTAVGICGSDVRSWRWGNPRLRGPQVLGHEVAGVVADSDSSALPVGTRVAVCPGMPCGTCRNCRRGFESLCPTRRVLAYDIPGGMAERFAVPAEAIACGGVVEVPASLPLVYAPLAETLHTVLNGQDRAAVEGGDRVLVLGLGPVGLLHAAVALRSGAATVLGVDPAAGRVEAAGAVIGTEHVLQTLADWEEQALLETDGEGWDVVVLASPNPSAFASAMRLAGAAARVLAFAGTPANTPELPLDIGRVHYRQLSIIGAFGGSPRHFARAVEWLATSPVALGALVTDQLPLSKAVEAFGRVESGTGIKTVLLPNGTPAPAPPSSDSLQ